MTEDNLTQLNRRISELQNECEKLSNQLMVFKQEKQREKQDSPRTPLQIKDKIKEKNHNNNSKMDSEKSKKGRNKIFVPPTLEEVQSYMDEIGETRFSAERFWNYYEAKGWVLGRSKMRFWKLVLDNWVVGENKKRQKRQAPVPQPAVVTFMPFKPVETKGAVSYEEYLRLKEKAKTL